MLTAALLPILLLASEPPRTIYGAPRGASSVQQPAFDLRLDLSAGWATDYVFRGIEPLEPFGTEDAGVYPLSGRIELEPEGEVSLFAELFAVAGESEPFDAVGLYRPTVGVTYAPNADARFTFGHTSFLYSTADLDTNELFARLDVILDHADGGVPLTSGYAMAAYDYDRFDGLYGELGLTARLPLDNPEMLRFEAAIAAAEDHDQFGGSGLQHYRVGVVGQFELNEILNAPRDRGRLFLHAEVFYTDGIDDDLLAETQVYGGVGLRVEF